MFNQESYFLTFTLFINLGLAWLEGDGHPGVWTINDSEAVTPGLFPASLTLRVQPVNTC